MKTLPLLNAHDKKCKLPEKRKANIFSWLITVKCKRLVRISKQQLQREGIGSFQAITYFKLVQRSASFQTAANHIL